MIRFVSDRFVADYDPTVEDSFRKMVVVDDDPCMLDIIDTAGQTEFSFLREKYGSRGKGFVLVYSITNRASFDEIASLYATVRKWKISNQEVPMILVGNKSDLELDRKVSFNEGQACAKQLGIAFFEASPKNFVNVNDIFYELVRQIRRAAAGKSILGSSNPDTPTKKKKAQKCIVM
jgi:small GTP-binding protein